MIDASRSPRPLWQRIGTVVVLAALIAVAAFVIWKKELKSPATAKRSPSVTVARPSAKVQPAPRAVPPATALPGGVPISARNPFGG